MRRVGRETFRLRQLMVEIGRADERLAEIRQSFLAVDAVAALVTSPGDPAIGGELARGLADVRRDIRCLDDLESSLSSRIQLLLDAANSFISIEQNEVVKVLTVVSVAGVPPVLIAGIYGMNFRDMPELAWSWGYPVCLAAIVVATVLPVLWFR